MGAGEASDAGCGIAACVASAAVATAPARRRCTSAAPLDARQPR